MTRDLLASLTWTRPHAPSVLVGQLVDHDGEGVLKPLHPYSDCRRPRQLSEVLELHRVPDQQGDPTTAAAQHHPPFVGWHVRLHAPLSNGNQWSRRLECDADSTRPERHQTSIRSLCDRSFRIHHDKSATLHGFDRGHAELLAAIDGLLASLEAAKP